MPVQEDAKKEIAENPSLGKRHDYGSEPQKSIRNTAVDLGFTAQELEELSKIYNGKVEKF